MNNRYPWYLEIWFFWIILAVFYLILLFGVSDLPPQAAFIPTFLGLFVPFGVAGVMTTVMSIVEIFRIGFYLSNAIYAIAAILICFLTYGVERYSERFSFTVVKKIVYNIVFLFLLTFIFELSAYGVQQTVYSQLLPEERCYWPSMQMFAGTFNLRNAPDASSLLSGSTPTCWHFSM